jgi:multidrug resistance efflux pump
MRRSGRRLVSLGLVVAVLAAAAWVLAYELQPQTESWVRVERRDLVVGVDVEGELQAVESARLGPPQIGDVWNFKISWMAPEGVEVQEGQPVLRFDATQTEQQLRELRAESDAAQKSLEKTQTDLEIERRAIELQLAEAQGRVRRAGLKLDVPAEVTARAELEKARIDRELAELEIGSIESKLRHLEERGRADLAALRDKRDRMRSRVAELEAALESMTVKAPRNGTLIHVANWRGEKMKVGDSAWRAARVMEIPDLKRMMAEGEVAEAHVGNLAVGQPVTLRLDAYPDREYSGRVRAIRRAVQRKSRRNPQKVVKLEIDLEATDAERMRPGMRFRGEIEIARLPASLVVPQEAVFPRPGGAVVYVRTLTGKREATPEFGERNQDEFAVLAGLDEGDWVLRRGDGEGGEQ